MLDRRSFLVLAGGAVALAACGGSDDDDTADESTFEHDHDDDLSGLVPGVLSTDLYVSSEPQRFAFAMRADDGEFASGAPVQLAAAPEGSASANFVDTTLHTDGLPDNRGVYVADLVLDTPGVWDAVVEREGEQIPFVFQVNEQAAAPTIGSAAPVVPSPTTDETLDVDPICTRDPACDLHTVSLDTALTQGNPVAVLFATPARCVSQYCGPVLDTMLPLVSQYEDRITFVHVEIYKDSESEDLVPTVVDWNLPGEPFLFGVGVDGTIRGRLDGAFGQDEMKALFDDLVAT